MYTTLRNIILATMIFAHILLIPKGVAQDSQKTAGRPEIERLRELANPGPEHEQLAKFGGTWKVGVTMGNGDQAVASNGNAKSYMTLENRFLWIGYEATGKAGRQKGAFTIGYDRRNDLYTLIAMDTYGTYFVTSSGKANAETGKIKMYGKDDDPHMKAMGFDKEFAHVLDLRKPDNFELEVYFVDTRTPDRKETRAMKFAFSRAR